MLDDEEYDDEPELAGYEPHGDRPLRSARVVLAMRVIVVVGLIGLVLPSILIGVSTANTTANRSCEIYVRYYAPDSVSFSARFELASDSGMGWNCYAVNFGGDEVLIAAMGIIPGGPRIPTGPAVPS